MFCASHYRYDGVVPHRRRIVTLFHFSPTVRSPFANALKSSSSLDPSESVCYVCYAH